MNPARNQVVARAFGSRLGENRCLELQEIELGEGAPGALQEAVSQHEVPRQLRAAQVEHPVLESQLLGGKLLALLAGDRNRGRLRRPHDLQGFHPDFDVASGEGGVARGLRPELNCTAHQYDTLGSDLSGPAQHLGWSPLGIEGELHDPVAVPQVNEQKPAKIAHPMHPAAEANLLARVVAAETAAAVSP